MPRTLLLTSVTLGVIGLATAGLDPLQRNGVWGGALCGALVGGFGAAWLLHTVRYRPQHTLRAGVEGFLVLLAGLLISALCVRFVPAAQEVVDWRLFIVAYAAGALVPLLAGTVESAAALKERSVA